MLPFQFERQDWTYFLEHRSFRCYMSGVGEDPWLSKTKLMDFVEYCNQKETHIQTSRPVLVRSAFAGAGLEVRPAMSSLTQASAVQGRCWNLWCIYSRACTEHVWPAYGHNSSKKNCNRIIWVSQARFSAMVRASQEDNHRTRTCHDSFFSQFHLMATKGPKAKQTAIHFHIEMNMQSTYTSRRLVYRACVLQFFQKETSWPWSSFLGSHHLAILYKNVINSTGLFFY